MKDDIDKLKEQYDKEKAKTNIQYTVLLDIVINIMKQELIIQNIVGKKFYEQSQKIASNSKEEDLKDNVVNIYKIINEIMDEILRQKLNDEMFGGCKGGDVINNIIGKIQKSIKNSSEFKQESENKLNESIKKYQHFKGMFSEIFDLIKKLNCLPKYKSYEVPSGGVK